MTDTRSNSALYGKGVFTTVAIKNGLPVLWQKHWTRLCRNAAALDIDLSTVIEESVLASLIDAIEHTKTGRARVTITDQTPAAFWTGASAGRETGVSVIVGRQRDLARPFRLTTSPHLVNSTSPLAGIKSCNYLEPLLSHRDAADRGYHEAVRVNERGHVTSACMANVFWVSGDALCTPALTTGCLPGTTREFVLEKVACNEVEVELAELENADAIYLTSAGIGIVAVDEFDGRKLAARDHPILQLWPPG